MDVLYDTAAGSTEQATTELAGDELTAAGTSATATDGNSNMDSPIPRHPTNRIILTEAGGVAPIAQSYDTATIISQTSFGSDATILLSVNDIDIVPGASGPSSRRNSHSNVLNTFPGSTSDSPSPRRKSHSNVIDVIPGAHASSPSSRRGSYAVAVV